MLSSALSAKCGWSDSSTRDQPIEERGIISGMENEEYFNHIHPRHRPHRHLVRYFRDNLAIVVGLVLIWRGIWYLLDAADYAFLGGSHIVSALLGIIAGLLVLYLPDRDLKELQKL